MSPRVVRGGSEADLTAPAAVAAVAAAAKQMAVPSAVRPLADMKTFVVHGKFESQ
jgi:hypothetical protein